MASGAIKKVSEKGFGFIDQGTGKDIFFHVTALVDRADFDNLQPGDPVQFEIDNDGDRPRAVDVLRIDG